MPLSSQGYETHFAQRRQIEIEARAARGGQDHDVPPASLKGTPSRPAHRRPPETHPGGPGGR